jgi:hypothetical protein
MRLSAMAALLMVSVLFPRFSMAGCKSDCRDQYDSARDDCVATYDDPEEADDLQMCLEEARSTYEECIQECDS